MTGNYRTWANNEVLTASDFSRYVTKQSVPRFTTVSARNTNYGSPPEGAVAYCADSDELYKRTNAGWRGLTERKVTKSADQSVVSSTTLVTDTHLLLAVEANATYTMAANLVYIGNGTGDFKYQVYGPAGIADFVSHPAGWHLKFDTADVIAFGNFGFSFGALAAGGFTAARSVAIGGLTFKTAATAGNVGFLWAQNVSNATTTKMLKGSWMTMTKLE